MADKICAPVPSHEKLPSESDQSEERKSLAVVGACRMIVLLGFIRGRKLVSGGIAVLSSPQGLIFDTDGNLVATDPGNHRLVKILIR